MNSLIVIREINKEIIRVYFPLNSNLHSIDRVHYRINSQLYLTNRIDHTCTNYEQSDTTKRQFQIGNFVFISNRKLK